MKATAQLLAVSCLSLIQLTGCRARSGEGPVADLSKAAPPRTIQVFVVEKKDLTETIEMPATVEGNETADLYAKVGGYLEEILVDIGDRVEQGQVLTRLSIPEMKMELEGHRAAVLSEETRVPQADAAVRQAEAGVTSAEAALEEAETMRAEKQAQVKYREAEFERTQQLVNRGSQLAKRLDEVKFQLDAASAALRSVEAGIRTASAQLEAARADVVKAEKDRDSAKALVAVAQAEVAKTEALLQYAVMKAPFTGVVTNRTVDRGAFIQPAEGNSAAQPLLTISSIDTVRVTLDLPMKEVRWLDRGDRAVLNRIDVLPGKQFAGTVTRFSASLDRSSRTMRVEIDLDNPEHSLLPGYYGYVMLSLAEFPQTPVIPSSALMSDQQGTFVYVIEDTLVVRRDVVPNSNDGEEIGIESGLVGGEHVVQAGGGQLQEGDQVTPVVAE